MIELIFALSIFRYRLVFFKLLRLRLWSLESESQWEVFVISPRLWSLYEVWLDIRIYTARWRDSCQECCQCSIFPEAGGWFWDLVPFSHWRFISPGTRLNELQVPHVNCGQVTLARDRVRGMEGKWWRPLCFLCRCGFRGPDYDEKFVHYHARTVKWVSYILWYLLIFFQSSIQHVE